MKHKFNCIQQKVGEKKERGTSKKQKYNKTFQIFLSTFFLRRNNEKARIVRETYLKKNETKRRMNFWTA